MTIQCGICVENLRFAATLACQHMLCTYCAAKMNKCPYCSRRLKVVAVSNLSTLDIGHAPN